MTKVTIDGWGAGIVRLDPGA